jgi:hypothetical protein
MLIKLKQLQDAAGVINLVLGSQEFVENEGEFDEVGESASARDGGPPQAPTRSSEPRSIERE